MIDVLGKSIVPIPYQSARISHIWRSENEKQLGTIYVISYSIKCEICFVNFRFVKCLFKFCLKIKKKLDLPSFPMQSYLMFSYFLIIGMVLLFDLTDALSDLTNALSNPTNAISDFTEQHVRFLSISSSTQLYS